MTKARESKKATESTLAEMMKMNGMLLSKRTKALMSKVPESVTITREQFARFVESTIPAIIREMGSDCDHEIYWTLVALTAATAESPAFRLFAPITDDIYSKETP